MLFRPQAVDLQILHVIPAVADRYGGPSQIAIEICQWSQKHSIDTHLVTTNADGSGVIDVATEQWTCYRDVKTWFFKRDFSEAYKYSRKIRKWLIVNVGNYDVVHIHAVFSHASIAAAQACIANNVAYVIRPLGTLDPWSMAQKPLRKQLFLWLSVKRILMRANAIQYTSNLEKQNTEALHGLSNGVVIPNGISCAKYATDFDDTLFRDKYRDLEPKGFILFMGRIARKKNIELLLESFAELKTDPENKNLSLVIAGTGDSVYTDAIRQAIHQHPDDQNIRYLGWVSGHSKYLLLQGASLFVLPSKNENYGIAVAESLAAGVAVVVSDQVYLHPEINQYQCGWVWQKDQPLSEVIGTALNSGELKTRGENGKKMISQQHDWPNVIAKLKNLYRDCSANGK